MSSQVYQVPDFVTMKKYRNDHYEVVVVPVKVIGDNRILVSPLEIATDFPLEIAGALNERTNMIICNVDVKSIQMKVPHICLLKLSPKKDRPGEKWVSMDSALRAQQFAVHNIVEKVLQSWRFDFVRSSINRLYAEYGEYTLMILSHQPMLARKILKISDAHWFRLNREWANVRDLWHEMRVLLHFGFDTKRADYIVDAYRGSEGVTMNRNPFRLAQKDVTPGELHRFFKAMSMLPASIQELESFSRTFMDARGEARGATAFELIQAKAAIAKVFGFPAADVENMLYEMIQDARCDYRFASGLHTVSMGTSLRNDNQIAENISRRVEKIRNSQAHAQFSGGKLPDGREILLNADQQMAVNVALNNRTTVITGGPGTGKTTTANAIIREIKSLSSKSRIFLAAPTGKAARRMSDVTGLPCMTLHRMLGMAPGTSCMLSSFGDDDTLIIDEMSMVDLHLFTNVIRHVENRGRLILLGDSDQLASVESGDVYNDLILTRRVPTVKLNDVQRQATESNIVMGSYSVLRGESPTFGKDLHFIKADSTDDIITKVKHLVSNVIPNEFGIQLENIQVLAAQRVKKCGVKDLNYLLKDTFNPHGHLHRLYRQLGESHYHVGDRIMYLKNRYDRDVQNGECGTIEAFDEENEMLLLDMDGKQIKMPYVDYQEITHAWAATVHKSQGSEYECVIVVLPREHYNMLTRNLIFTAMTRGKKHVFFVAEENILSQVLENNAVPKRRTHLSFMVAEGVDKNRHDGRVSKMTRRPKIPTREVLFASKKGLSPTSIKTASQPEHVEKTSDTKKPIMEDSLTPKKFRASEIEVPF
jgi:exodeoxyribonuclease V alpha subunit